MKRTTVKISDELDARLRHEAARRGVTLSELTREALETHIGLRPPRRVLAGGTVGHSGQGDVARRIEEILAEEWTDDLFRDPPEADRSAS
jgi:hypothetical protein